MRTTQLHRILAFTALVALVLGATTTRVWGQSDPGITSTEILLGGTHPFSGPASLYGNVGKGISAYFAYINDNGGVNGRKITYKDLDDGYSPPQTVQLTHQLVEQDHVFAVFDGLGTAPTAAVRPYLNDQKVPQIFVATGASTWGADYVKYPWTIGWQPDYQSESEVYAKYILQHTPNAKIGIIQQNDDFGQDSLAGLNRGLGAKAASMVVKTATYETTDPDVNSQIASLKASGADTFVVFATPKFAALALISAAKQGWHPTIYLNNVAASQPVLRGATAAAGPEATNGIITALYLKDPSDPKYNADKGITLFKQIMAKYVPAGDTADGNYLYGMSVAFTMVDAMKKAGKDITRQKLMDAASHLDEHDNPFLLPGVYISTTPTRRFPITELQLFRYNNGKVEPFSPVIEARR